MDHLTEIIRSKRKCCPNWAAATLSGVLGLAWQGLCFAADDGDAARAQALFDQGRELLTAGRYEEACPLFAESQRLDPGGGTLLNLAICHEREKKYATAWAEYQETLVQAGRAQRADRMRTATEHLSQLASLVPHLNLRFASQPPAGTRVEVDGHAVEWQDHLSLPVDPGEHTVIASAPGFERTSTLGRAEPGEVTVMTLPALVRSETPAHAAAEPTPPIVAAPLPGVAMVKRASLPAASPAVYRSRHTAGFILGGVGVALLGVGGYFGVRAVTLKGRSDDGGCTDTQCPTPQAKGDYDSARTAAHLSSAGLALGLVTAGVGAYLILTDGRAASSAGHARGSTRFALQAGPQGATVSVGRGF